MWLFNNHLYKLDYLFNVCIYLKRFLNKLFVLTKLNGNIVGKYIYHNINKRNLFFYFFIPVKYRNCIPRRHSCFFYTLR